MLGAPDSLPAWASVRPKKQPCAFLSQASAGACLPAWSLEFRGQNSLFMGCSSTSIGVKVGFQGEKWVNTGSNTTVEATSRVLNGRSSVLTGRTEILELALES